MTTEFELDWGKTSPDLYNEKKKEAMHVYNFSMLSEESRRLAQTFIVGKVLWCQKHLPGNSSQIIDMDIRGQDEIKYEFEMQDNWRDSTLNKIKAECPEIVIEMNIII